MAETWHCKNAIKDERVQKDGECLHIIDMTLAMGFPCVFPKTPFIAEEAEFLKAVDFLVRCLVTVVYMLPLVIFDFKSSSLKQ